MTVSKLTTEEAGIWERVIRLGEELSLTAARALVKLQFSEEDRLRMQELAAKARADELSPEEQRLIDTYERLGCLLDILHSKSRRALKRRRTAS